MAAPCSVCSHGDVTTVDRALVAGDTVTAVAERHGLTRSSVTRHRDRHVSAALAAVAVLDAVPVGGGVVGRVEALVGRAERLMALAEGAGSSSGTLAAMAECRRTLELLAKLTGELDERPQLAVINLQQSPEWLSVRTTLMRALEPFPSARVAVAQALTS